MICSAGLDGRASRRPDPLCIRPGLLVDELSAEGVWRLGQRAEPQLAVERPLTPFELADTHPGPSSGLLRRHEHDARGFEDKGPAVEAPEELDL